MFEVPEGLARRLATIVASDIVGCSRLMGRNEGETVRELKRVRRRVSKKDR
jgi:class 3 adenylate cyclase